VLSTLVLCLATGWIYAAVALAAGGWFIYVVHKLYRATLRGEEVTPLKVFLQSNEYLAIVFCGLAIDSVIGLPTLTSLF
jgi:protoheme IX farnesyltransferase